ncbi:Mitochondrial nicotinamide adenine dinucleotide transporter SLC25A51 [Vulpes lagopus]
MKNDLKQHGRFRSSRKEAANPSIFETRSIPSHCKWRNAALSLLGCCAAFNNVAITFPVQKVLYWQQLYGLKTPDAVLQLRKDDLKIV